MFKGAAVINRKREGDATGKRDRSEFLSDC